MMGEEVKIGVCIYHCDTTVEDLAEASPLTRADQKLLFKFLGFIVYRYIMR